MATELPPQTHALLAQYPAIAAIDPALRDDVLARHTMAVEAPTGTVLFDEGAPCRGFPLVIAGEICVARGSPQGRSLELYRVAPGEMCVVSTSCALGRRTMVAHGMAARDSQLIVLSPTGFDAWCADEAFRRYVFGIFAERLADLMALVEAIAFQRLDQRLAAALLNQGPVVHASHQALADQLGTVREIVSRLLKQFERTGLVRVTRERTEVLDAAALRDIAANPGPT